MSIFLCYIIVTRGLYITGGDTMTCKCDATIDNPLQRDNLIQCINIIGATPTVHGETVYVSVSDNEDIIDKMIRLFEQFHRHSIRVFD